MSKCSMFLFVCRDELASRVLTWNSVAKREAIKAATLAAPPRPVKHTVPADHGLAEESTAPSTFHTFTSVLESNCDELRVPFLVVDGTHMGTKQLTWADVVHCAHHVTDPSASLSAPAMMKVAWGYNRSDVTVAGSSSRGLNTMKAAGVRACGYSRGLVTRYENSDQAHEFACTLAEVVYYNAATVMTGLASFLRPQVTQASAFFNERVSAGGCLGCFVLVLCVSYGTCCREWSFHKFTKRHNINELLHCLPFNRRRCWLGS